ncbi:MAG: AraC family transcriptional regulator [Provencibacterium sp.]|nr:AraC family transcriptional regulator [Provencibacterium sp.]
MEYIYQFLSECSPVLEDANLTRCWPDWGARLHRPAYNRLYYILEGEGEVLLDGDVYRPKPGQLCLLPAGRAVELRSAGKNCYTKYWCHFRAEARHIRLFDLLDAPVLLEIGMQAQLLSQFSEMVQAFQQPGMGNILRARAALLEILSFYLSQAQEQGQLHPAAQNAPTENLQQLTGYIEEHLCDEMTLESLARQLHFHPNYFSAFFKKHYGVSPLKYVAGLRLQRAKELLRDTSLPVAEVAARTGFHDLFHFSRRFKEQTGYSPSDFRKL